MSKEYIEVEKQALADLFYICQFLKMLNGTADKFNRQHIISHLLKEFDRLNQYSQYPSVTFMMLFDHDCEPEIYKILTESEKQYKSLCF